MIIISIIGFSFNIIIGIVLAKSGVPHRHRFHNHPHEHEHHEGEEEEHRIDIPWPHPPQTGEYAPCRVRNVIGENPYQKATVAYAMQCADPASHKQIVIENQVDRYRYDREYRVCVILHNITCRESAFTAMTWQAADLTLFRHPE